MSTQTKPSIVFAHGLWADGSCYSKLIPTLQAEGHEVVSAQNSLDSLEGDVAAVRRALGRVSSPAVLVGHSQGGTIITHAGTDDRVAALVYICALAPDEDETASSLLALVPPDRRLPTHRDRRGAHLAPARRDRLLRGGPLTRKNSSSSGRRRACPLQTCSTRRFQAPPGSRSRAGTSWATTTEPSIPTWSVSWRTGWVRPPTSWTAATSPCCPSQTAYST